MVCVDPSPLLPSSAGFNLVPYAMDAFEFAKREDVKYDALFVVQARINVAIIKLLLVHKSQCITHGRKMDLRVYNAEMHGSQSLLGSVHFSVKHVPIYTVL